MGSHWFHPQPKWRAQCTRLMKRVHLVGLKGKPTGQLPALKQTHPFVQFCDSNCSADLGPLPTIAMWLALLNRSPIAQDKGFGFIECNDTQEIYGDLDRFKVNELLPRGDRVPDRSKQNPTWLILCLRVYLFVCFVSFSEGVFRWSAFHPRLIGRVLFIQCVFGQLGHHAPERAIHQQRFRRASRQAAQPFRLIKLQGLRRSLFVSARLETFGSWVTSCLTCFFFHKFFSGKQKTWEETS